MAYVKDIQIGNNTYLIEPILYGICETIASESSKSVNIPNFELIAGVEVRIKFTYENSATNPTLNISNTGAKAIIFNGPSWNDGEIVNFIYDGTQWVVPNYGKIEVVRL